MTQPSTQRPPQVTLAGSVVMFASVIVVLTAWDNVSKLRSLETRETLEVWVDGPFSGLDLESAIAVLHVCSLVAGTCAAATAGLGWLVMRRDKAARIALAVLAVPLFLSGLLLGGFASSFVAAAAAMLWLSPAKEWFATGRWTPPAPRSRAAEETRRPAWPPVGPGVDGTSRAPRDVPSQADPGALPGPRPHPGGHPGGPAPTGAPVPSYGALPPTPWGVVAQRRPQALVTAVVLTIVPSVFVAALALMALAVGLTGMEPFMDQLERQQPEMADDLTAAQWRDALVTFGVVTLALSALAVTFAAFVSAGHEWARRGLMATAAFCAGACFLMAVVAAPVLLFAGAAVATVVLLNRQESRDWCRSHRTTRRT